MPKAPAPTADPASPAVEVRALVKNYGKVEALRGVDLQVGRGEMFALLGPNGAGKTTLFSDPRDPAVAHLRARRGCSGATSCGSATRCGRRMGIVFQEPAIEQRLSGRDNLLLMGLLYGLSMSGAKKRAAELLAQLGLAEAGNASRRRFPAASAASSSLRGRS